MRSVIVASPVEELKRIAPQAPSLRSSLRGHEAERRSGHRVLSPSRAPALPAVASRDRPYLAAEILGRKIETANRSTGGGPGGARRWPTAVAARRWRLQHNSRGFNFNPPRGGVAAEEARVRRRWWRLPRRRRSHPPAHPLPLPLVYGDATVIREARERQGALSLILLLSESLRYLLFSFFRGKRAFRYCVQARARHGFDDRFACRAFLSFPPPHPLTLTR